MKIALNILALWLFIGQLVNAQDIKPIYFEKAGANMVRFFFDKNYYLVDKNCEFKYIERVAQFSASRNMFTGIFKDFGPNGNLLLTGNYVEGKKEGLFTAYHPNNKVKWEANFLNDEEVGTWKYYYPDGKPMLELVLDSGEFKIINYYNRLGQAEVQNGQGEYDITMPIDYFTEHGFTKFNRKGKVVNGKPEGTWLVSFVDNNKRNSKYPVMVESFHNGLLQSRRTTEEFAGIHIQHSEFHYAPIDYFSRAELLFSKTCSFDEHTGFNSFIASKFQAFLNEEKFTLQGLQENNLTYSIHVAKNGTVRKIVDVNYKEVLSNTAQAYYNQMLQTISYYLPSYLDNQPIDDILTIDVKIHEENGKIHIPAVRISREKGM